METNFGRVCNLAEKQHGAVAVWQLRHALGLNRNEIVTVVRRLIRVHHGVYAVGDLGELGWLRAATLACGPQAAISHETALMLLELRPFQAGDIHVSVPRGGGRRDRGGIVVHRRTRMETGTCKGIPVTSPSQSLKDADLEPYALYRALERARALDYALTLPLTAVVRLEQTVRGRTRSDAEARVLLLCAEHAVQLPLVNHMLNGIETDFHWPQARVVLEVDGWEFHMSREQFEEDRRRTLIHSAAGWQVLRISGLQVQQQPELLLAALQTTGW